MAAVWTLWRRAKCESDPRLADKQVQGIRFRYDDKLRRGRGGYPVPEWIRTGKSSVTSLLQDQQPQVLKSLACVQEAWAWPPPTSEHRFLVKRLLIIGHSCLDSLILSLSRKKKKNQKTKKKKII